MPRLTAIIITRNEAANIGACLDSAAFCDERIVVDCGSDDDTTAIAKSKGAHVTAHAWQGFGPQKNFALSLATGEWVLSIDADERVTPELAVAIGKSISEGSADGYEIRRRTRFLGQEMRQSQLFPDYILRLFRRGRARFTDALVHEGLICAGPVARIPETLLHDPVWRLEDALSRIDRYSTASAEMLVAKGRQVSVRHRDCTRDLDVLAYLHFALRLPRRPRRFLVRGGQCRGQLLPIYEGLAYDVRRVRSVQLQ